MTVLFVNACLRGEQSRTLTLCREYLEGVGDVEEVNLAELKLEPYYGPSAAYRAQLEKDGQFDDPMFDLGRQFAEADEIVIGAPYWDLSFPAALKIYIEHAAVMGMTFHYTEEGYPVGLGKVQRLLYVTTAGGPIQGRNCGFDYVKTLCGDMLGVPQMDFAAAENLDVWGADVEGILTQAEQALRQQIRGWQD